jgi:hypothetical protein
VPTEPTGYDHERTTRAGPRIRQRLGVTTDRGDVVRFVVQLEYLVGDKWEVVVRYDHDEEGETVHDVTEDGLHIDIYRDGEKHVTEYIAGPIPAGAALDLAEDHLAENTERFVRRFEEWHQI